MEPVDVEKLSSDINSIKNIINERLIQNPHMPRVIMIGVAGAGKSALANCLSQKELIISEGVGMQIEVQGEGVQSGSSSVTRCPQLYLDHASNIIYCDCPGFEDSGGFNQEIINSYAIDHLFQQINDEPCLLKILLIVSSSEFDAGRGQGILKSIERITRIFSNNDNIKEKMGIVITKNNHKVPGINYLLRINQNSNETLNEWCDYFINHPNQIFTFPMPSRKNIGKQYSEFDDKYKIIKFLQSNQLVNPIHNVAFNESSILHLKEIGNHQMANAYKTTNELFQLFARQYQKSKLSEWSDLIHALIKANINNVNDFIDIIQGHKLKNNEFNPYFSKLENYETLSVFIGNVLNNDNIKNCVCSSINSHLTLALNDINIHISKQKIINDKQDQIEAKNKIIKDKDGTIVGMGIGMVAIAVLGPALTAVAIISNGSAL